MESDRISGTTEDRKANVTAGREASSLGRGLGARKSAAARFGAIAIVLRVVWLSLLIGVSGRAWAIDWKSPLGELKQAAKQKAVDSADVWLNRTLELEKKDAQAERAMSPEAQSQAPKARAAFEAYLERGAGSLEVYNPHDFTTAKRQIEHYRRVVESLKGRSVLTPGEVRAVGDAQLPFFRYVYSPPDGTTAIDGTMVDLAPGQKATVQSSDMCLE